MSLTTMIVLNAVLAAAVVYALHHLLAHGIRNARFDHRSTVAEAQAPEAQRRAA